MCIRSQPPDSHLLLFRKNSIKSSSSRPPKPLNQTRTDMVSDHEFPMITGDGTKSILHPQTEVVLRPRLVIEGSFMSSKLFIIPTQTLVTVKKDTRLLVRPKSLVYRMSVHFLILLTDSLLLYRKSVSVGNQKRTDTVPQVLSGSNYFLSLSLPFTLPLPLSSHHQTSCLKHYKTLHCIPY